VVALYTAFLSETRGRALSLARFDFPAGRPILEVGLQKFT
jgi:hypothetical protein